MTPTSSTIGRLLCALGRHEWNDRVLTSRHVTGALLIHGACRRCLSRLMREGEA